MVEAAYIARLLTEAGVMDRSPGLAIVHFAGGREREIFEAAVSLEEVGGDVNILTVARYLRETGSKIQPSDLMDYQDPPGFEGVPVGDIAEAIIAAWREREAGKVAEAVLAGRVPTGEAAALLGEIDDDGRHNEAPDLGELIPRVEAQTLADIAAARQGLPLPGEIQSGIPDFDQYSILRAGEMVVIGARPGMGKSSLARTIVRGVAAGGTAALMFTQEMSPERMLSLIACTDAEVNSLAHRRGALTDEQYKRFAAALRGLQPLPIRIEPMRDMAAMRGRIKRWRKEIGPDRPAVVIVDYIQQVRIAGYRQNRNLELTEISNGLQALASGLGICLIAFAQLSRDVEKRGGDRRPVLADLRDSGSFEQDADAVLFIHRQAYYGFDVDDNGEPTVWRDMYGRDVATQAEILIRKNRNGALGMIPMLFIPQYTKFEKFTQDRINQLIN
jgi:replicative DNA helicase